MNTQTNTANEYDQQATDFLTRNGLKMRITLSDSKSPAWAKEGGETGHHYRITLSRPGFSDTITAENAMRKDRGDGGKWLNRLVFDFWGSIADAKKMQEAKERADTLAGMLALYNSRRGSAPGAIAKVESDWGEAAKEYKACHPSAYSVLACISSDAYTPETFADFCAEYGYESDSIKALQTFRRCDRFAKRLRAFFTEKELTELSEIQ